VAILDSLSPHVRRRLDQLGDALSLQLPETERLPLADLLGEHDTLSRRIRDFDRTSTGAGPLGRPAPSAGDPARHRPHVGLVPISARVLRWRAFSAELGRAAWPKVISGSSPDAARTPCTVRRRDRVQPWDTLTAIRRPLDPSSRDLRFLVDVLHDRAYEFLRPGRRARLRDPGRGRTQAVSPVGALAPVGTLEPLLLHSCSDRALHRDTRNAQEAFPQGKTLG